MAALVALTPLDGRFDRIEQNANLAVCSTIWMVALLALTPQDGRSDRSDTIGWSLWSP